MKRYNPKEIEPRWQKKWEESHIYQASEDPSKPKKYILEYFPYPSGAAMHVGHVRNYTIGDVLARFNRMAGYNVLHPMGWDGFGLPAENYAIKTGISPRQAIDQNTARFKEQLMQMGFSYDWSREIDSTDPEYYRWTQWFFLLLFKLGLAYQQESLQWWCPFDKTVLANEQVEAGRCWRCGNEVEKKALKQWFFKITDYADRLAKDLDDVDWSESIKSMQRNWIGRSTGAEIAFQVDGYDEKLTVFTTRPDTLYGATFMVLSPEHPLVKKITTADRKQHVTTYVKAAQAKSDIERQETNREKTGAFTGAYAINPVNGEKIPIWIADYVLMGYGTGAIMAVPAHDERDHAFAEKFGLPIIPVVAEDFGEPHENETSVQGAVVIGYDKATGKYLGLRNKNGSVWLVGGNRDGDEDYAMTAKRELEEETGYRTLELIQLGDPVYSHYYNEKKDSYRRSFAYAYLAIVDSSKQGEHHRESHEDFVPEWFDWQSLFTEITKTGGGVEHWLAMLERAQAVVGNWVQSGTQEAFQPYTSCFHDEGVMFNSGAYNGLPSDIARERIVADLSRRDSEPTFVATDGESAIKPGEEFIKREAVVAVVKDPKTNTYLCTSWKTHQMNGLVTGGVETGEDPIEAAKREIHEETGYKNVRLVADPGIYINSLFYHRQKKQNRWAHFHFIFFELENDERDPVDEHESALQEAVWKEKSELADFFSVVEGKYIVDLLDDPMAARHKTDKISGSLSYEELVASGIPASIIAELEQSGAARERVNYKMRDWLISRQRYWGAPIPIIHCPKDGAVAVPEDQLPVRLPELQNFEPRTAQGAVTVDASEASTMFDNKRSVYEPSGDGRSPLANVPEFVNTTCPKCGGPAERETDTMDGFACSSWYFLRFADPHNNEKPFDADKAKFWLPVDDYIGGAEHAVMHLLYARMWTKVMFDQGMIDFNEPFKTLRNQGMILAPDGQKMSKSKGNTIEPGVLIDQGYGADAIRIMELFIGPWNQAANWSVEGMGGAFRFLQRIWTLVQDYTNGLMYKAPDAEGETRLQLLAETNKVVKKVTDDIENMNFNTAIAAMMEHVNNLYKIAYDPNSLNSFTMYPVAWLEVLRNLLRLLAPIAPHIAEELWAQLLAADDVSPRKDAHQSVHLSSWPQYDERYLLQSTLNIVVQINGKLRGEIQVPADSDEAAVTETAKTDEKVASHLQGVEIRKTIYVPGRLVNFVV